MKAVISSTFDDLYLFNLPIVTWLWNKLGVGVICFMHAMKFNGEQFKLDLINRVIDEQYLKIQLHSFVCPEHKEATYAQCLRNYAACLDLDEGELLVTSDVDMALFKIPKYIDNGLFSVLGYDLVPMGQYPQCYITGSVKSWRDAFNLNNKTYQQAIDELLGEDECEHYRGNRWSVDQEQSFLKINPTVPNLIPRARPGTQFAEHRYDRDDAFLLDRLSIDTIDYHMPRPGYESNNFHQILTVLNYHYPNENFNWLWEYRNEYLKLL